MKILENGCRQHFALYYRINLDKNGARGNGLPIASAGECHSCYVGAGIAETPDDIGMKILGHLYREYGNHGDYIYSLLFNKIAFMGLEVDGQLCEIDKAIHPVPTNDVNNMSTTRVCLVVGDIPQVYVSITHLLIRGEFPLHTVCPPRQHFYLSVNDGPDHIYDGRVWWFSLEGIRFCERM